MLHNISKITTKILSGFVYPSLAYIKTATSKIAVKSCMQKIMVRKRIYFVDRASRREVTESCRAAMASHLHDSSVVTRLLVMAPERENSI